jgi:hypothetical protein
MRRLTALQQHCGRLCTRQAYGVMGAAPAPAVARLHVRHQSRCQRGIHLQPASVHAPAVPQWCGVQSRSRSAAACAAHTDARSGQHHHQQQQQQQQQPISQSDYRQQTTAADPSWDIKMLYDGDCPLCMREVRPCHATIPWVLSIWTSMLARRFMHTTFPAWCVLNSSFCSTAALGCCLQVNMLRRRDAEQGRISFVDIASPEYSAADNADVSYEQVATRGFGTYMLAATAFCV